MKKSNLIIIIIALLVGALAGAGASLVASSYLGKSLSATLDSKEVDIANSVYDRSNLVIRDAKKVVVNQDAKIEEVSSSLQPSLVSVFKKGAADYYAMSQADGFGLILSSDGWVFLNGLPETAPADVIKSYAAVSYDKKVYEIDKAFTIRVTGDGNAFLIHLKGASSLTTRPMAGAYDLKPGSSIMLLSADGQTLASSIIGKKRPNLLLSSDRPDVRLTIASPVTDDFKNGLVFDLSGSFVGWVDGGKAIRPNYVFFPAWRAFVAKSQAVFPALGVNYLNLAVIKAPALKLDKGAWLKNGDAAHPAVVAGSPAEKAGLKAGDVITRINNQELDQNNDLAELLSAYLAGETVDVTYSRNGVINDVNIVLGEAK
jgi:hypothetical protein